MKNIAPNVARQLTITFFIANLPLLMLISLVVASLSGVVFGSPLLFWFTLFTTPVCLTYVGARKHIKQFCQQHACHKLSCLTTKSL
uniref:hypothetical protein n=1 Tax=Pseudoalteromonas mariniglutinosa TaxID=206042 RepID=UPI00387FB08A